jgi:hypothetical protein
MTDWAFVAEWETPALEDPELLAVLKAPFSYLSKGAQSYVFLSRNEKYVLKLFRFDACRMPLGRMAMTQLCHWAGLKPRHFVPAEEKIPFTFNSCMLAYRLAQKQTGLAYVHLNLKKGLPLLTLVDRLGRVHQIDPAKFRFALQCKAESFDCHNGEEVRLYRQLLNELSSMGLTNTDRKFKGNFGCIEGRVIAMDFGNFIYSPERAKEEVVAFEKLLEKWIDRH